MEKNKTSSLDFSLDHLVRMTDKIGLLEHCTYTIPNKKEGYSLDDNARALLVLLRTNKKHPEIPVLVNKYFKFILSAATKEGFHNDLNQNLEWNDKPGTREWFGRAMEALAETAIMDSGKKKLISLQVFDQQLPLIKKAESLRTKAHLIIALSKRLQINLSSNHLKTTIINLADDLVNAFEKHSEKLWRWFEDILTYDNTILPISLFYAYETTDNKKYFEVALESLNFLVEKTYHKNKECFSFPGNKGWMTKNGFTAIADQQPIEAGGMVEACVKAYLITKSKKYHELAWKAFEWYNGRNLLGLSLIDHKTGGIKDGLEENKVNQNEGAESILSYCLAILALKNIN